MFFASGPIHPSQIPSVFSNLLPDYIKPLIYGSDNPEIIALKEQGLSLFFEANRLADSRKINAALETGKKALNIFTQTQDLLLQGFIRFFMGEVFFGAGRFSEALEQFEPAYEVFKTKEHLMRVSCGQKVKDTRKEIQSSGS